MQVEITAHKKHQFSGGDELHFSLKNVDASFANALRRVMLAEIPSIAIDHVTVHENTSPFVDEMIVHRLGLVPLNAEASSVVKKEEADNDGAGMTNDNYRYESKSLLDSLVFPRDCDCQDKAAGCSRCRVRGHLAVTCPPDRHKMDVYSTHLKFDDPRIMPVLSNSRDKGILLLTLGRGQCINLVFKARKGIAKEHSKWMVVGTVVMRYEMDIRLGEFRDISEHHRKEWVERCPAKVFKYNPQDKEVTLDRPEACIYCRECLSIDTPFSSPPGTEPFVLPPTPLAIVRPKINSKGQHSFSFIIESTGAMPAMSILLRAITALETKLMNAQNALTKSLGAETTGNALPTKTVGHSATAVRVVDQDALENERKRNDLERFIS